MLLKDAIAQRIEVICADKGLTMNALAYRCGITPSTLYSLLDKRRRDVSVNTLQRICDGADISLAEFFSDPMFGKIEENI